MKIKKLTMKAFGSYGDETTLDYSELLSGLYLIRGKTGAGKTTIFDAIMIALYGEASGERRNFAMFHSDFVPKSTPSEVDLVFEHNGLEHRVRRTQRFIHHRGTDDYDPASPDAEFWEAEKDVIQNSTSVTRRITELIGLDAGQFRQIVMLAQGDFRKFLDAKSDERGLILRKIFDTSEYRGIQERLGVAYGKVSEERKEISDRMRFLVDNMTVPPDLPEEERLRLKVDHPLLVDTLTKLVEREKVQREAADEKARIAAEKKEEVLKKRETAQIRNDQLEQLEKARQKAVELKGQKTEMEGLDRLTNMAVRALPAAKAVTAAEDLSAELTRQESYVQKEMSCRDELARNLEAARNESEEMEGERDTVRRLTTEQTRLDELKPEFGRLNDERSREKRLADDVSGLRLKIGEAGKRKDEVADKLKALEAKIAGYGKPEVEVEQFKTDALCERQRAQDFANILRDVQEIEKSVAERKVALLERARKALERPNLQWEDLSAGEVLAKARDSADAGAVEAVRKHKEAAKRAQEKDEVVTDRNRELEARDEAEREYVDLNAKLAERENELTASKTSVEELQKQLGEFDSQEKLEARLVAVSSSIEEKNAEIKRVDDALRSAEDDWNRADSKVKTLNANVSDLKIRLEAARRDADKALSDNNYSDVARLKSDLAMLPEKADEQWLVQESLLVSNYKNDVSATAQTIDKLTRETEGCVMIDLVALEKDLKDKSVASAEADRIKNEILNLYNGHVELLQSVREGSAALEATKAGWNRLGELTGMVCGTRGNGADRLDFERYMLGANLREVLSMANRRLDIMSGGRYELVHRVEGTNRNGAAGLDIDVLDHVTGARRQAGSFSGGEGFQASMALALGLSDVVKNHAGCTGLDSTFIDEGFGSLDGDVLEKCVQVLKELAGGSRQVGIISHVEKLEEDVWPQIVVESGTRGSTAHVEKR